MASIRQINSARQNGRRSQGPKTPEGKARSSQNALKHGMHSSAFWRSQGPKTPEGKARSSQNALKHGMHSSAVVLNSETSSLYDSLLSDYVAEYQPADRREHDLVEAIVDAMWRLNRILTIECTSLDYEIDKKRKQPVEASAAVDEGTLAALAFAKLAASGNTLGLLSRHEGRIRRTIERSHNRLIEMQKCRNEPDFPQAA